MGNGVVDMQEIEGVEVSYFGHAGSEGEIVRGVFEERVGGYGDFVEVDVGLSAGEAEGLRGGDEVDLVAASCQFDSKLGGDDSAAAVGGIAGDSDLHAAPGNALALLRS